MEPKDVIARIAEVADAVAYQSGTSGSETAGMIVSALARQPDQIERFLSEGTELIIDGTISTERGCLSYRAMNGKILSPDFLSRQIQIEKLKAASKK